MKKLEELETKLRITSLEEPQSFRADLGHTMSWKRCLDIDAITYFLYVSATTFLFGV